jgi:hypothetical protein
MTKEAVEGVVFAGLAAFGTATVGAAFNRCSYQRSRLNTNNSAVTSIVRLPCTGTRWGGVVQGQGSMALVRHFAAASQRESQAGDGTSALPHCRFPPLSTPHLQRQRREMEHEPLRV